MKIPGKLLSVLLFASLFIMSSCVGKDSSMYGRIDGVLVNGRDAKVAKLYGYMPEYGKTVLLDSADVAGGRFYLSRRSGKEVGEAFVTLDDGEDAYCFLLSDSLLTMEIGQNGYVVKGTAGNEALSTLIMKRQISVNERRRIQGVYADMQADSTLTKAAEDSLLDLYRRQSAGVRTEVLRVIDSNIDANRQLSELAYRLFSYMLTQQQSDSIAGLLNLR